MMKTFERTGCSCCSLLQRLGERLKREREKEREKERKRERPLLANMRMLGWGVFLARIKRNRIVPCTKESHGGTGRLSYTHTHTHTHIFHSSYTSQFKQGKQNSWLATHETTYVLCHVIT